MSLLYGKSIRKTAEEVGLDKDTVHRIWGRVTENWERIVEEFLEELNLQDISFEDMVSFQGANLWRSVLNKRR